MNYEQYNFSLVILIVTYLTYVIDIKDLYVWKKNKAPYLNISLVKDKGFFMGLLQTYNFFCEDIFLVTTDCVITILIFLKPFFYLKKIWRFTPASSSSSSSM